MINKHSLFLLGITFGLIFLSLGLTPISAKSPNDKSIPLGLVHFPNPTNFPFPDKFPIKPSSTPGPTFTPSPTPTPTPTPSPQSFYIVSDTSWKYSDIEVPGWKDDNFDDSTWTTVAAPSDGLCPVSAINPEGRINQNGAQPMWTQTPVNQSTAYFRKEFNLTNIPQQALIRTLFDDDGDIYINGNLVLSSHNSNVEGIQYADITNFLQVGTNVIAIVGIDAGGCQSVQFELAINP